MFFSLFLFSHTFLFFVAKTKIMKKGKLIVIEGNDGSGKGTQAKLIVENLKKKGKDVLFLDFPVYDSVFGKLLSGYLRGDFGDLNEMPPEIPTLLFAIDRYQFKDKMFKALEEGKIIICNRYTESNIGFQGAKFDSNEERDRFIDWLRTVESRIPKADLVFFLDIPLDISWELVKKKGERKYLKGKERDIHERNIPYQQRVREVYLEYGKKHGWKIINCVKDGKLRSIEDINNEIMSIIEKEIS